MRPLELEDRDGREHEAGADELTFLDITASHEDRDIMLDVVQRTAEACFMPLTVGGGVRTIDDIRALLAPRARKLAGAIAGRALYDGRLDAAAALTLIRTAQAA